MSSPAVPLSSLPLQVLIYFNGWLASAWVLFNLGFYAWKGASSSWQAPSFTLVPAGYEFPYKKSLLAYEIVFTLVYGLIESCRLQLGMFFLSNSVCALRTGRCGEWPVLSSQVQRETKRSLRGRLAGSSASLSSRRRPTSTSSGSKSMCTFLSNCDSVVSDRSP